MTLQYSLADLIDLSLILAMAEAHSRTSGIPFGLIDARDHRVLGGAGWQEVCAKFHRANPHSIEVCAASNRAISAMAGLSGGAYQRVEKFLPTSEPKIDIAVILAVIHSEKIMHSSKKFFKEFDYVRTRMLLF